MNKRCRFDWGHSFARNQVVFCVVSFWLFVVFVFDEGGAESKTSINLNRAQTKNNFFFYFSNCF